MIKSIKRFFNKNKKERNADFLYKIEGQTLYMPAGHKLPEYQNSFHNYDQKLKIIVKNMTQKYDTQHKGIIIDIGANVGDTTAAIRPYTSATIYCVEGDHFFLPYLHKNLDNIDGVEIIENYVGISSNAVNGTIERNNGTAKINKFTIEESNSEVIPVKSLDQILTENRIEISDIDLIKIDTDGFDFSILLTIKNIIRSHHPNLFFEYDINYSENDLVDSLDLINFLASEGYALVIYDNFGNLLDCVKHDHPAKFRRMNHYLQSCRQNGGGLYYIDIFATSDQDLANDIISQDTI